MISTNDIKRRAKDRLMNCFAESAFISMLNIGLFFMTYLLVILSGRLTGAHTADSLFPIFSGCPPLFLISLSVIVLTSYLVSAPIYYGTKWFFWQAAAGNTMPASSVFAGYSSFEQFKLCIKLRVLSDMRRLPYILIFGTAAFVEGFLAQEILSVGSDTVTEIFIYTGLVLVAVGVIYMCFCAGLKCVPVGFLLADNPDGMVSEMVELSESLVKRNMMDIIKLYISFAGWFLSCLPAFPVIILMPYFNVSLAILLRDCIEKGKQTDSTEKAEKKEAAHV